MSSKLFNKFQLADLSLSNRIVMAPMTRGRATNEALVPVPIMEEYYRKRASAGLIITEGTWVNREGVGYINVPGIYTEEQTQAWKKIVHEVHQVGGKIFSQLAHIGAVSHPDLLGGALPLGPSAVNPKEKTYTFEGFKDTPVPREMTLDDIRRTVNDFRRASENAKRAGFDGVEIHGGYLYLIPEFLNSDTNIRKDKYGGSIENRCRIVFELLDAVISVWGKGRVGIKLSPAVASGLLRPNADTEPTYRYLIEKLNNYPLAYLHAWGFPVQDDDENAVAFKNIAKYARSFYRGVLLVGGGYDRMQAERVIAAGDADLVAFGLPFIANPDLVARMRADFPLAEANPELFYTGGIEGYTDYPALTDMSFA